MRILFTGAFSPSNKGDEARVRSSLKMLKEYMTFASFGFLSTHPEVDSKIFFDCNMRIEKRYMIESIVEYKFIINIIKVIEVFSEFVCIILWRISGKKLSKLIRNEFRNYDMFVDVTGETLTSYYGTISLFRCLYTILIGKILDKPVVVFAQTIGPFNRKIQKVIAKIILKPVDLITVRDQGSLSYLEKCGFDLTNVHLTADPAFVFDASSADTTISILENNGIGMDKPLLGITLSRGSYKHSIFSSNNELDVLFERVICTIGEFINYATERYNFQILFVPHATHISEQDRRYFSQIMQFVKHQGVLHLISDQYTSRELKGVISHCDLFIGSRMHANISALSSCVPTIALAYSEKMRGLMEMLGQAQYVLYMEEVYLDVLIEKFEKLYLNRASIRKELGGRVPEIQKRSLKNAELVCNIAKRYQLWH